MNLDLTNKFSSLYEPMRKNRWIMTFTLPTDVAGYGEKLSFAAHTANRPQITFEETESHRQNERFYVAGKPTWNEITMNFYDFIDGEKSASHIMWLWSTMVYNPLNGAMGYKKNYSSVGTLALLDPVGTVAESWNLFFMWPREINWNELDSSSSDLAEVSVTFRYDYAIKGTTPQTIDYEGAAKSEPAGI